MVTLGKKPKHKRNYFNTFFKKTLLDSQATNTLSLSLFIFLFLSINSKSNQQIVLRNTDTQAFLFHFLSLLILLIQYKQLFLWLAFNNTTSSPLISCTLVHNHNKLLLNPLCFLSKPLILKITHSTNNHLGPMPPLLLLLFFILKTLNLLLLLTPSSPNSPQILFLGCFG